MSIFIRFVLLSCLTLMAIDTFAAEQRSRRGEPAKANYIVEVTWQGVSVGPVELTAPIESRMEVIEYQDGDDLQMRKRPGRTKFQGIQLKVRNFNQQNALFNSWIRASEGRLETATLDIIWREPRGRLVRHVRMIEAWVSGVTISLTGEAIVTVETEQTQFLDTE